MDKRLEEIDNELQQLKLLGNRVTWLESVIAKMAIGINNDGIIVATLSTWLRYGKEFITHIKSPPGLQLIDRRPVCHSVRKLWYFYCDHTEQQLNPDNQEYYSPVVIPLVINSLMKEDRIDTTKLYYDDHGHFAGWETEERAMEELNKAALQWACNVADAKPIVSISWTSRTPTQPGYYWYKSNGSRTLYSIRPTIVEVYKDGSALWIRLIGSDQYACINYRDDAEWVGPIPEPTSAN